MNIPFTAALLFVVFVIAVCIYDWETAANLETKTAIGLVKGKKEIPLAVNQIPAGDTYIPLVIPATYKLSIGLLGTEASFTVDKASYESFNAGDTVVVRYTINRYRTIRIVGVSR